MIRLTSTAILELITAQNGAQVVVGYSDQTTTGYLGNQQVTSVTSGTTTTVCAAPAASTTRDIDLINVKNTYAGTHEVTLQVDVGGTNYALVTATLVEGGSLTYTHGSGWAVFPVASGGGTGDMILAAAQTVTGAKTFEDGTLIVEGATSGAVTLKAAATTTSYGFVFPATDGAANQVLKTDGSGNTDWVDQSSGGALMADGSVPMTGALQMGANGIVFEGSTANDFETTLNVIDPTADRTINLPNAAGTVALTTDKLSAFAATTSAELAGVISDETGSGALVFGTSPTLTTPTLGAATATSINKMAITAPSSSSTLAVADGKTFTASNTLTLAGTDSTTLTFPPETSSVGYMNVPQNSKSEAYTAVIGDAGKHLLHPSADTTARTFTIPANSSVAYPVGTALTFVNQASAGVMTIAITSDTMRLAGAGTTGSRTLAANGIATALKVASTEWIISGTGLT